MSMNLEIALADVRRERERQDKKWGPQNHSMPVWLSILAEEFGEASKDINEFHFRDPSAERMVAMREELIQTAAVAVAMIEYIDRHNVVELNLKESESR